MKADLARQQREILDLQKTVDRQQKLIEQLLHFSAITKPVEESAAAIIQPAATTLQPTGTAAVGPTPAESSAVEPIRKVKDSKQDNRSPLTFRLGNIYLTPAGFFDFTAFIRDRNVGSWSRYKPLAAFLSPIHRMAISRNFALARRTRE
jgi:hypothetical protein